MGTGVKPALCNQFSLRDGETFVRNGTHIWQSLPEQSDKLECLREVQRSPAKCGVVLNIACIVDRAHIFSSLMERLVKAKQQVMIFSKGRGQHCLLERSG